MGKNKFSKYLAVKWGRETKPEWMVADTHVSSGACVCAFCLGGTVCAPSNLLLAFYDEKDRSRRSQCEESSRKYETRRVRGLR